MAKNIVENVENKTVQSVSQWNDIKTMAGKVLAVADSGVKKDVEKLVERIKYSDPVSNDGLKEIETNIKAELEVLNVLLSKNDNEASINKISELMGLVEQRNQMCKGLK